MRRVPIVWIPVYEPGTHRRPLFKLNPTGELIEIKKGGHVYVVEIERVLREWQERTQTNGKGDIISQEEG